MSDNIKARLPIFDGRGFADWKFRMQFIMEERDLLDFVEKDITTLLNEVDATASGGITQRVALKKGEKECKSLIVQCLSNNMLEYIRDKSSAHAMFTSLKNKFEQKGIMSQTFCRKRILGLKFKGDETLDSFFLTFDGLVRELKDSGAQISEEEMVSYVLLSLPPDFNPILTALETVEDSKLTLTFVKEKLLNFEMKNAEQKSDLTKNLGSCSNESAFNIKSTGYRCGFCNKKCYKWADCFLRKNQSGSNGDSSPKNDQ